MTINIYIVLILKTNNSIEINKEILLFETNYYLFYYVLQQKNSMSFGDDIDLKRR